MVTVLTLSKVLPLMLRLFKFVSASELARPSTALPVIVSELALPATVLRVVTALPCRAVSRPRVTASP